MSWSTHPVTLDRFEDFADVINPNRRGEHCWCTPHRLRAADVRELGHGDREQAMRALCRRDTPPGILAYSGDKAVGWCNVGARDDIPKLVHSKLIRPLDQVPVWSIVCLVVRGGHRKQGVSARLIEGAVEFAASRGPRLSSHIPWTRAAGWTPRWRSSALGACSRRQASTSWGRPRQRPRRCPD